MQSHFLIPLFTVLFLLSACGGSDDKSANKAPVIVIDSLTIDSLQQVESGESLTLNSTISDPENDSFVINWASDNQQVKFSKTDEASTIVTFPATNVELIVKVSVSALDANHQVSFKEFTVTINGSATTNAAPIITMATTMKASANESIVLIATVHDPDNDDISLVWHSENSDITFSDKNSLTTSVTLPDVTSTLTTKITLTATDSQQNKTQKSLSLTINAEGFEPDSAVYIELVDRINATSASTVSFNAIVRSNTEIKAIVWDLAALNSNDISITNINEADITTSTVTLTAPNVTALTERPITLTVTTIDDTSIAESTRIFIAVDSIQSLLVTLPENDEVTEGDSLIITPTIENSHAIDSYQWRWISEQALTLLTPTNKVLNLSAPQVDADIQGQLELTVNMGGVIKKTTMDLLIKNSEVISTVNVTASRLVAVKGQKVTLNVITDNFEQIKSWSWETSRLEGVNVTESKSIFEITAPNVNGQKQVSVIYRATLIDDSEVVKIANITVLSQSAARSTFTFAAGELPIIYNNIEKTITFTFTDRLGLVDSISLNKEFTFNKFTKEELTRTDDTISLVLLTNDINFDHYDFMSLMVNYGDYKEQYPIQLDMRVGDP